MKKFENTLLLFSGGLDSICAFYRMGCPPSLYVGGSRGPARAAGIGEAFAIHEMRKLDPRFDDALQVANVDFFPFMRAGMWNFPREIVLALTAWGLGYDRVAYGYVIEDRMTAPHVRKQCKRISDAVGYDFKATFPFWKDNKTQMIVGALEAGAPVEIIKASYSCVIDPLTACGKCDGCIGRARAFKNAGVS